MFTPPIKSLLGSAGTAAAILFMLPATPAFAAKPVTPVNLTCSTSTTLEALVDCISVQMPQHDSNGFIPPNATESADFAAVVTSMLEGNCANITLPASLSANMAIRTFADSGNSRNYCLLMEVRSSVKAGFVDKGWGTFITYNNSTRRLSHHSPHPKLDTSVSGSSEGDAYTQREAIRIFKKTDSRSFLMAGSRRSANLTASTCQGSYWQADCAHNTVNMYYPANVALSNYYAGRSEDWTAIEWHGKASTTCANDVFMSMGQDATPPAGSKLMLLKAQIQAQMPSWVVENPGSSSCDLVAATNTSGRFHNGVTANVCSTAATSTSGRFLHIEQTTGKISDYDGAATAWANAIIAAFP